MVHLLRGRAGRFTYSEDSIRAGGDHTEGGEDSDEDDSFEADGVQTMTLGEGGYVGGCLGEEPRKEHPTAVLVQKEVPEAGQLPMLSLQQLLDISSTENSLFLIDHLLRGAITP